MNLSESLFPEIDFSSINGNDRLKTILNKTRFHSYLICGENCEEKGKIIELLVSSFICNNTNKVPCGTCDSCKKNAADNHPDIIRIDSAISSDDLRSILEFVFYKPNTSPNRVFIFENADKLTEIKQNIILKTIEEPPENNIFILIAESADTLLQTVLSRCLLLPTDNIDGNNEAVDSTTFGNAVLQGDEDTKLRILNAIENADRDKRRSLFTTFVTGLSSYFAEKAKEDYSAGNTFSKAAEHKKTTDKILTETLDVNVNVSVWLGFIFINLR